MNKPEILSQQRRENPDPDEGRTPIPWLVLALAVALAAFGVDYISHSNLDAPATWGDGRSAAELAGDKPAAGAKVDGGAIFNSMCAACHQATGLGLPGVFPPLAGSEWVLGKPDTLAAILLHGVSGPLEVKGTVYQGAMPAFGSSLGDAEIAAVLTHLGRMVEFWSTMMLDTRTFSGSVFTTHMQLKGVEPEHFARWMTLWHRHTANGFETAARERLREVAGMIGRSLFLGFFSRPAKFVADEEGRVTVERG